MSDSTKPTEVFASSQLQHLLNKFNSVSQVSGTISIQQAKHIFQEMHLRHWDDSMLSKNVIENEQITFDQFLVLLQEMQEENDKYKYHKNYRIIEFLKLLQDYRIQCQNKQQYDQAQKTHEKIEEIKQKQVKRLENQLSEHHRLRTNYVKTVQRDKISEFQLAWREYKQQFQEQAQNTIENLKAKHQYQLEKQQYKIRKQLAVKPRHTRAYRQLKQQQKLLVQRRDYTKAKSINALCQQLQQQYQSEHKRLIQKSIEQKTQALRRKQQAILAIQLKKIKTTRDLQIQREKKDAQKLNFKLKKLKQQVLHKETIQKKQNIYRLRQSMSLNFYNKRKSTDAFNINNIEDKMRKSREKHNTRQTISRKSRRDTTIEKDQKKDRMKIRIACFNLPRTNNHSFISQF